MDMSVKVDWVSKSAAVQRGFVYCARLEVYSARASRNV